MTPLCQACLTSSLMVLTMTASSSCPLSFFANVQVFVFALVLSVSPNMFMLYLLDKLNDKVGYFFSNPI